MTQEKNHRGEKPHGSNTTDERRRVYRRSEDQPEHKYLPFCEQHSAATDMVKDLIRTGEGRERDVAWMIKLGHWFLASLGAALLFFGGVAFTMVTKYGDAMKLRDDIRSGLQRDLNQATRDIAVNSRRLDTLERDFRLLNEKQERLHPQKVISDKGLLP